MNVANDLTLWGFKESLEKSPLPAPYQEVKEKTKSLGSGRVTLIRPLIKAVCYYAADLLASELSRDTKYIALGSNASSVVGSVHEKTFVELRDPETEPDMILCTVYDPADGSIKGGMYRKSSMRVERYQMSLSVSKKPDGTAVWLCLLPTLLEHVACLQTLVENTKRLLNTGDTVFDTDIALLFEVSRVIYKLLTKDLDKEKDYTIKLDADLVDALRRHDLQKNLGPAFGKVQMGEFEVFPVLNGKNSKEVIAEEYDLSKYSFAFQKADLSAEEQLLVPTIPKDNVTPKEAVELLDEMQETWNNPPATKVTQVLLEGGAGSGKSYLARLIAAVLKRPFVTFTCSPNTDEADIKGALLPVASESEREDLSDEDNKLLDVIYESSPEDMQDKMAVAMGLPDSMECLLAPDSAYEQLTGIYEPSCDSQKAYAELSRVVMTKVKDLMNKVKSVSGGDGVRYKYIPSEIVRAIQNGWILELQEPSCMLQQGMLSCLFDVLDKDSIGVLNTITGPIKRHPDFMVLATTNRKYKGTKPLNEAARSRFQYFVKMETPSTEVIIQRVIKKVDMKDPELVREMTDVFQKLIDRAEEINATGAVTLRGLYAFADAIKRKKDPMFALEHYLLYSITTDDDELAELRQAIEDSPLVRC